jgi:hypothetical protein
VFGLAGPKVRAIAQHHPPVPVMHLAELCDALAAMLACTIRPHRVMTCRS